MRGLTLLLLAGTALGRPQDRLQASMEDLEEERKAHPSLITNCIAENSNEGLDQVRECLKCFENSGDPLSEEGLPKAKACTEDFLPRVTTDCAEPLAALEPENEEMGSNALRCFADVTQIMAAEDCLEQAASEDMVETLTDGVICLKDKHKNVTMQIHKLFEKEMKKDFEKFKKMIATKKKPKMPKKDPMREQMMSLISKRHCEIASNTEEEEIACMECFESTKPRESEELSKSDYVKSLATCSAEHLSPHYDECTTMMEEMAVDPEKHSKTMGKGIFLCYMRVVTKSLVEQCSNEMELTDTTPENLLNVMQCGSYTVFEWMQKNVRFPKLEKFSPEDYSLEDQDEEDFYNEVQ